MVPTVSVVFFTLPPSPKQETVKAHQLLGDLLMASSATAISGLGLSRAWGTHGSHADHHTDGAAPLLPLSQPELSFWELPAHEEVAGGQGAKHPKISPYLLCS